MKKLIMVLTLIFVFVFPVFTGGENFALQRVSAENESDNSGDEQGGNEDGGNESDEDGDEDSDEGVDGESDNSPDFDTSKLQYFELHKPISVCRDEQNIYVAEEERIIIYKDDTYNTIDLKGKKIEHIEKCGKYLLFLSNNSLYKVNTVTKDFNIIMENIVSFAVSGDNFAVNKNNRDIVYYKVNDKENFIFEQQPFSSLQTLTTSPTIAITDDYHLFYKNTSEKNTLNMINKYALQAPYTQINAEFINQIIYADKLFYKTTDKVYSIELLPDEIESSINKLPEEVVNLHDLGVNNSGDIFISGDKMLICDTDNDKVLEYDLTKNELTGFEISFSKVRYDSLDFTFTENPQYIEVPQGTQLYEVDLEESLQSDYFKYKGYAKDYNNDFLIINTIKDKNGNEKYYLIAGEKYNKKGKKINLIALVLKNDFAPEPIVKNEINQEHYLTSSASGYKLPYLIENFKDDDSHFSKHEEVKVLSSLDFNGINYSMVESNGKLSYLPTGFLVDELYIEPTKENYQTATTYHRICKVYNDENLTQECDSLDKYTDVIIKGEYKNCYLISYGENNDIGYIKKSDISKNGWQTNRAVAAIIICSVALLITCLYLEQKYLYSKNHLPHDKKQIKKNDNDIDI